MPGFFRKKKSFENVTSEFGVTGLKQRGGVLAEEFLPELRGLTGRKIFAEMRDNDPTIGALLNAIELMLRAVEGDTSSMAFINRNKMLLCHRPNTPGFQVTSAGYLFSWQGYTGLESPDMAVSSFYLPQLKSDRYEGEIAVDAKITGADLGVFLNSVVA